MESGNASAAAWLVARVSCFQINEVLLVIGTHKRGGLNGITKTEDFRRPNQTYKESLKKVCYLDSVPGTQSGQQTAYENPVQ